MAAVGSIGARPGVLSKLAPESSEKPQHVVTSVDSLRRSGPLSRLLRYAPLGNRLLPLPTPFIAGNYPCWMTSVIVSNRRAHLGRLLFARLIERHAGEPRFVSASTITLRVVAINRDSVTAGPVLL